MRVLGARVDGFGLLDVLVLSGFSLFSGGPECFGLLLHFEVPSFQSFGGVRRRQGTVVSANRHSTRCETRVWLIKHLLATLLCFPAEGPQWLLD